MVFIAGVGHAVIMDGERLVATANTLVDSSITIGLTMEDVKRGMGNKLYGRYAHDATFGLKLTDAMFNLEYLAMNTGSDIELGGDVFATAKIKSDTQKKIVLPQTAVPVFGGEKAKVVAYAFESGTNSNYVAYEVADADNSITVDKASTEYCLRYMIHNDYASKMVISSNFIPKTLSIILTANLYSGGSCDLETSTLAGSIQIKVYRFMLNGNQDFSMTATGVAQTSLEGTALAYGCQGCDGDGAYAEITQVFTNVSADSFSALIVEDAERTAKKGDKLAISVYACPIDGAPIKLANSDITVATGTGYSYADGVITISDTAEAGDINIAITSAKFPNKTASLKVTVEA